MQKRFFIGIHFTISVEILAKITTFPTSLRSNTHLYRLSQGLPHSVRHDKLYFKASFIVIICLFLGLSRPGISQQISLSPNSPEVQVPYVKETPTIDGHVFFKKKAPWVPVLSNSQKGENLSISIWYHLKWNEEGLYIAAVIPQANLQRLIKTGLTPDAPFELNLNLDVQPKPTPGAPGNYRLQFIPLVEIPSMMLYESHAFKFNHYLGSDSRLTDPGLVVWHELSLSHIQPQGIRTRWARMSSKQQGLSFEAFIPWENLGLDETPTHDTFFDMDIDLPEESSASWVSGIRKARESGGRMVLLQPDEAMDVNSYHSDTIMLQSSGDVVTQQQSFIIALPVVGDSTDDFQFILTDKEGQSLGNLKIKKDRQADIFNVQVTIPDISDGRYSLQIKDERSGEVITQKSLYLAGELVDQKIIDRYQQLSSNLKSIQNKDKEAWQSGYLTKAQWLLDQTDMSTPASIDHVNEALAHLDKVERILRDLEDNNRPASAKIDYYRPGEFVADGQRGPVKFVPTEGEARLTINTEKTPSWELNPLIYGTFSEPVVYDRPIYGMLYAQELRNSSLEWGHPTFAETMDQYVNRYQEIDAESARQLRSGAWVSVQSTDENEVAAPWIGIGTNNTDFSLTTNAFNSKTSQRITNFNGNEEAGVAQLISLPIWRQNTYHFKGHFRTDDSLRSAQVKLYYKGEVIDQAQFSDITSEWKPFEATLTTPEKQEELENGFLLSVTFEGAGSLYADQLTLFPADSIGGADPQVVNRLKRLNPEWIRWPGGNFASGYHWKGGVGAFKNRTALPNPSWPGLSSHFFGTDEYMRLNQEAGLEPLITVNAGDGTPEEATDWVEYANGSTSTPMGSWRAENGHSDPYNVKYWNIGNELWGSWQVGYSTPYDYVKRYRSFTRAMTKRDPDLTYIAIGVGPFSLGPRLWSDMLVDSVQTNLDIIDFHAYLGVPDHPGFDESLTLETLIDMPIAYEQGLMTFRDEAVEKGREDLKVIVGEYNSSTGNIHSEWQSTAQLLSYAGWLHGFIRQGEYVIGANATEYSVFDPRAEIMGTLHPRNKLYKLYHDEAGTQPLKANLETPVRQSPYQFGKDVTPIFNIPIIDGIVLKDPKDGSLAIGLINRDVQNAIEIELDLNGYQVKKDATHFLLQQNLKSDQPIEVQEKSITAESVFSVSLPAHSVSLIKVNPK